MSAAVEAAAKAMSPREDHSPQYEYTARKMLDAALPHLTEGLEEVTKSVLDRRPYSDATRSEIRGLEHAIARAITDELKRRIGS